MSRKSIIYDRNHMDLQRSQQKLMLYVDGSFQDAPVQEAYEGRLQIHNAVGNCSVELLTGTLPPGYNLFVDNDTSEVVLTWPAYSEGTSTITNDFSAWNGWEPEFGFVLDAGAVRYDGFGENGVYSPYLPVIPGTNTTLSISAKCGASGHENVGFRSVISWYDADKNFMLIPGVQDAVNNIHTAGPLLFSPSDTYIPSAVTATVPTGAVYGRAYASCTRNRENKPMWVDNASWTLQTPSVGVGVEETISLSLRVTDSAGRTADWSGDITVAYIAYEAQVMLDNPLAYWKANETSGTVMADSSGNGHDATYNTASGVTLGASPLRTGATGSLQVTAKVVGASIASTGLEISATPGTPWAMECIVKKTATLSSVLGQFFGAEGTSQGGGNRLMYRWGASQNYIVWDAGNDNRNSPNATTGQIVHVVVEMGPIVGITRTVNLYENGRQVYTGTVSGSWHVGFEGAVCMLGTTNYPDSYSIAALGSDFALYDHVLGATRVAAHAFAAGLYVA